MSCAAQASGVVAARLPSRPIDSTMAVSVEKRSGGNQREITTMLPISMTPKPAPISTRPVSSTGQVGASVNMRAADGGEHQHAGYGAARAEMVEEEAARNLHRGEAEEERAGQRAQRFRPDREVAHQIEADGDVGGAEKMAGDIGGGQCRDDDQAPAVGERAPLSGPHRSDNVPLLVEKGPAGVLCVEPMRPWRAVQGWSAIGLHPRLHHEMVLPGPTPYPRIR